MRPLARAVGAPGRVIVATFASLISRVQLVLDAAELNGRKVAVLGRSMVDNVAMASKMGHLKAPDGVLQAFHQRRMRKPADEIFFLLFPGLRKIRLKEP